MLVIPGTEPKHLRAVLQLRLVFRDVRQGGCSGHMYGYMQMQVCLYMYLYRYMKGFRLVILGSEPWHVAKRMCCPVHEFSVICTVSDIAFQGDELTPTSMQ